MTVPCACGSCKPASCTSTPSCFRTCWPNRRGARCSPPSTGAPDPTVLRARAPLRRGPPRSRRPPDDQRRLLRRLWTAICYSSRTVADHVNPFAGPRSLRAVKSLLSRSNSAGSWAARRWLRSCAPQGPDAAVPTRRWLTQPLVRGPTCDRDRRSPIRKLRRVTGTHFGRSRPARPRDDGAARVRPATAAVAARPCPRRDHRCA